MKTLYLAIIMIAILVVYPIMFLQAYAHGVQTTNLSCFVRVANYNNIINSYLPNSVQTGKIIVVNGSLLSLVNRNLTIALDVNTNGTKADWVLVPEPTNNLTALFLPANSEIPFHFDLKFLKHGTYFLNATTLISYYKSNSTIPSTVSQNAECNRFSTFAVITGVDIPTSDQSYVIYEIGIIIAVVSAGVTMFVLRQIKLHRIRNLNGI